ncbi:hypothetical protein DPX16_10230 [Anabarilius grahami]|uniref:Interleukin-12 subunit alpha n=1 Tax=Anabarilius grahami TaxID=495550 RepID=A0A3N0Y0L2_ANAGA|nr:hypothetical protein DPX16_10230 [Anabarilius grahami]
MMTKQLKIELRVERDLAVSILCFALCRCGIAGPVGARESPLSITGTTCNAFARSLLWNVSAVLEMDHLFSGFDCTQQNAEVHIRKQTVSACTPQNECLQKILEDLHYYRETFRAYSNSELTKTVVRSIDDLMQESMDYQKSFKERLQLCKVLKGFNRRAITINRVFNYILAK